MKEKGPAKSDNKLFGNLYASSKEPAFLENLQITKKICPDSKSLSVSQIEEKLDDILRVNGEEGLNSLRDKAKELAQVLEMKKNLNY